MNQLLFLFSLCMFGMSYANAGEKIAIEAIKCQADISGTKVQAVPVSPTMGAAPEQKTDYLGNKLAVGFFPGDGFENQQVLSLEMNGYASTVYDPGKSLYTLTSPDGARIQCYINEGKK